MIKIAIIGAGSAAFSRRLIVDIVEAETYLRGSQVILMDIVKDRLETVKSLAAEYAKIRNASIKFEATLSREEALRGADFVINIAFVPGYRHMEAEREIAERYGYYRGLGDRVSDYYGGIGAYAQLSFFVSLAKDMERLCPKAWLLQSANPVLEGATLIARESSIRVVGMCHGYARFFDIVRILGLSEKETEFEVTGLNHCIWLTRFVHKGENAYPLLDQWLETKAPSFWNSEDYLFDPHNYQLSPAAFAMYKLFGLFPIGDTVRSVSPWWFHLDLNTKKKWFPAGGVDSEIGWSCRLLRNLESVRRLARLSQRASPFLGDTFLDFEHSCIEPHIPFIISVLTSRPAKLVLNIPNNGLIKEIPNDVYIETSCIVCGDQIEPKGNVKLPDRLLLYVILPRWLRMERILQAYRDRDLVGLVLEIADDRRTQSIGQAIQVAEELLAQPWNKEAYNHYKDIDGVLKKWLQ